MKDNTLLESIKHLLSKPSHAAYFFFSIFSSFAIYKAISETLSHSGFFSPEYVYFEIGFSSLLVAVTFTHLIYIYLSLIQSEEYNSFFSCWINKTKLEICLRHSGMFFLIGVFGKFPSLFSDSLGFEDYYLSVFSSVLVFAVFIIWSLGAYWYQIKNNRFHSNDDAWEKWNNNHWIEKDDFTSEDKNQWLEWAEIENRKAKKTWEDQLRSYARCDGFAFFHWTCIAAFLISANAGFLVASFFFLASYAYFIIFSRVKKDYVGHIILCFVFGLSTYAGYLKYQNDPSKPETTQVEEHK